MSDSTQLAKRQEPKPPIAVGSRGVQLASFDEAWRFATAVQKSGLAPKQFDTPEKILIAIQSGAELGMSPMSSLQGICVINGRPSLYGDALPALAWGSGVLEEFKEWIDGEGDAMTAYCFTKRKGQKEGRTTSFSVADAKRAKLWMKKGRNGDDTPWVTYPTRMLAMRARSWNFRDNLADVLRGVGVEEEVRDFHSDRQSPEPVKVLNLDDIPDEDETEEQRNARLDAMNAEYERELAANETK